MDMQLPVCTRVNTRLFYSLPPGTSLVQILIQLGPDITSDPDTVRALLKRFGISDQNPPRDEQIIETMTTLARLASEGTVMCDVSSLVRALNSYVSTGNSLANGIAHCFLERQPQLGKSHQVV
jgi:hypothetical protein